MVPLPGLNSAAEASLEACQPGVIKLLWKSCLRVYSMDSAGLGDRAQGHQLEAAGANALQCSIHRALICFNVQTCSHLQARCATPDQHSAPSGSGRFKQHGQMVAAPAAANNSAESKVTLIAKAWASCACVSGSQSVTNSHSRIKHVAG